MPILLVCMVMCAFDGVCCSSLSCVVWFLCLRWFPMVFIVWNCQGAGSKEFIRVARFLIKTHNPRMFALFEPKTSGVNVDGVCKKLKFNN